MGHQLIQKPDHAEPHSGVLLGGMMKNFLIAVVVLVLITLLAAGKYVGSRNEMVRKSETANAAWSQVDVVLQRRADLIPNLVETVKGYAAQEKTVFADIANARASLLSAR